VFYQTIFFVCIWKETLLFVIKRYASFDANQEGFLETVIFLKVLKFKPSWFFSPMSNQEGFLETLIFFQGEKLY
jgi:hypothetical protein